MAGVSKTAQRFIDHKMKKLMKEGVKGRVPDRSQAFAIASDMARRKGLKVPKKSS